MTTTLTRRMRQAFDDLTVTHRQVLFLYGLEHLPVGRVGHQLGLPGDAVRCIFAGACQRLSQVGARFGGGVTPPPAAAGPAGENATVDMLAESTLLLAELFRADALRAAGRAGLMMPAAQVRVGEEIRTDGGWESVAMVLVDGGCCSDGKPPTGACSVQVETDARPQDDPLMFDAGKQVRVRTAVAS
jgi:hypothetical protein